MTFPIPTNISQIHLRTKKAAAVLPWLELAGEGCFGGSDCVNYGQVTARAVPITPCRPPPLLHKAITTLGDSHHENAFVLEQEQGISTLASASSDPGRIQDLRGQAKGVTQFEI